MTEQYIGLRKFPRIQNMLHRIVDTPFKRLNWMQVSRAELSIAIGGNLDYYLEDPTRFVKDAHEAVELSRQLSDPEAVKSHMRKPMDYTVYTGLHSPDKIPSYEQDDDTDDYLTVIESDPFTRPQQPIGVNYYIRLDKHYELVRQAQMNIEDIVAKQVENGISRAVSDNVQRLEDIDRQMKKLQREREKLEAAELKRLEREREKAARRAAPFELSGYVYLLKAIHDATLYKIGCTSRPEKRKHTFDVKLPFPVEFECLISTPDMYELEAELHARFAAQRLDGEWFRLSEQDVSYIQSLAGEA